MERERNKTRETTEPNKKEREKKGTPLSFLGLSTFLVRVVDVSVSTGGPPVRKTERVAMRPQSCKSKGRRLQQRVARSILEAFPHLGEDDVHSTSMGAPGEDVRLSPLARDAVPLSIECKCVERLNVWAALEQAEGNCPRGATPCVVFSRNRATTYAAVPWDVLLALYRARGAAPGAGLPPRLRALLAEMAAYVTEEEAQGEAGPSTPPSGAAA